MRETRQVTILKCDQCRKVQQDDGLLRMGTPVLDGWFHLSKTEDKYDRANIFGHKDFCSMQCLIIFCLEQTQGCDQKTVEDSTQIDNDGCLN